MPTWKELVDTTSTQTISGKTLDTATVAVTQSASNNTTAIATTAYADAQAALGDTTLANTKIWIGDSSGDKAEFALSGDVAMTAGGAVTIGSLKVVTGMLAADAVTAAKIGDNAITADHIGDEVIINDHMGDDAVDTDAIEAGAVTLGKMAAFAANTVLVRDANSSGAPSAKAVADTQVLIGDGTGFTAAALSGDASMTNAGAVTVTGSAGDFTVGTSLRTATIDYTDGDVAMTIADGGGVTTSGALTVTGDLTVNGTTTTVNTATLEVEDHIILLATNGTPTPDTGTAAGIQVETSATEGHMPEITWTKDVGASNDGTYDGAGTLAGLTGWRVSNHQVTNQRDFAIQVCDYKTDTGAPSSENSAGMGAMLLNTYDQKVYVRTA